MLTSEIYQRFKECVTVSTDTRKINEGALFIALKGPNFNGNQLSDKALELGARYVVVDEEAYKKDDRYILVPDGLKALQDLAKYHRQQLDIPVIAITGSNGKTTTKELVHAVLSKKYKPYATVGNLNNHIGVPLTLLSITADTEIAIIEMGANHQKEIEFYCQIALPTHGLITNIGKAHLEGFGGIEGVKKGKGELYQFLRDNKGKVFVNSCSGVLMEMSEGIDRMLYPQQDDHLRCELLKEVPAIEFKTEDDKVYSSYLTGRYNYENMTAAICIGKYFNIPLSAAAQAVADYNPQNNRSQRMQSARNTLFLDAYNANPSSMKVAIDNFLKMEGGAKMLILGDMFELGEESYHEHYTLGTSLAKSLAPTIILCGKEMQAAYKACPQALYFPNRQLLEGWLSANTPQGMMIFVKGSRSMGLEKLIPLL